MIFEDTYIASIGPLIKSATKDCGYQGFLPRLTLMAEMGHSQMRE